MRKDAARADLRGGLGGGHRGVEAGAVDACGADTHVRPPLVSSPIGRGVIVPPGITNAYRRAWQVRSRRPGGAGSTPPACARSA